MADFEDRDETAVEDVEMEDNIEVDSSELAIGETASNLMLGESGHADEQSSIQIDHDLGNATAPRASGSGTVNERKRALPDPSLISASPPKRLHKTEETVPYRLPEGTAEEFAFRDLLSMEVPSLQQLLQATDALVEDAPAKLFSLSAAVINTLQRQYSLWTTKEQWDVIKWRLDEIRQRGMLSQTCSYEGERMSQQTACDNCVEKQRMCIVVRNDYKNKPRLRLYPLHLQARLTASSRDLAYWIKP